MLRQRHDFILGQTSEAKQLGEHKVTGLREAHGEVDSGDITDGWRGQVTSLPHENTTGAEIRRYIAR
jgi:hypothetical protein